ncbi:MAG: hypothetical protein UY96_C0010G0027 [Parcubacteria group bacterium GW2011_GWB1_56_8]|nr:MAG: hypothetical protein UY96_C0010G0027 [Parcubacteria group bacterium GW2011_GWB1_56_8]
MLILTPEQATNLCIAVHTARDASLGVFSIFRKTWNEYLSPSEAKRAEKAERTLLGVLRKCYLSKPPPKPYPYLDDALNTILRLGEKLIDNAQWSPKPYDVGAGVIVKEVDALTLAVLAAKVTLGEE